MARFTRLFLVGLVTAYGSSAQRKDATCTSESGSGESVKKVAVVGAGVSGLVATKWLLEEGHQVKTFEKSGDIGGNWRYSPHKENTCTCEGITLQNSENATHNKGQCTSNCLFTSCYKNLRTITHSSSMTLEGHPMSRTYGAFPHHSKIYRYLAQYCDANPGLRDHLILNTKVLSVSAVAGGYSLTFSTNGIVSTEFFDAVAVCNGHNSHPYWPKKLAADLQHFSGDVRHSRAYRFPQEYSGKNVLILGGGISGKQIAFDVSTKANLVAISSNRPMQLSEIYCRKPIPLRVAKFLGSEVRMLPPVGASPFSGKEVKFSDGSTHTFDSIIVCTGYQNKFPFLDSTVVNSIVKFPENSDHPSYLQLYKHTFPIPTSDAREAPTLAFIGMVDVVDSSMFSVADVQAKWFARLLSGRTRFPPLSQILAETQNWKTKMNFHYHPMSISSTDDYPAQILQMIEENKS